MLQGTLYIHWSIPGSPVWTLPFVSDSHERAHLLEALDTFKDVATHVIADVSIIDEDGTIREPMTIEKRF